MWTDDVDLIIKSYRKWAICQILVLVYELDLLELSSNYDI